MAHSRSPRHRHAALLPLCAALLIFGCERGDPPADERGAESTTSQTTPEQAPAEIDAEQREAYVGSWVVDTEQTQAAMEAQIVRNEPDPAKRGAAANLMRSVLKQMRYDLDLRVDGTFDADVKTSLAEQHTGTWRVDGDSILLSIPDHPDSGRMVLKRGKLHTAPVADEEPPPMVLKRKP